jgi:hypothetical protein
LFVSFSQCCVVLSVPAKIPINRACSLQANKNSTIMSLLPSPNAIAGLP